MTACFSRINTKYTRSQTAPTALFCFHPLARHRDGLRNKFLQDLAIDIVECLDVEAPFAGLVLSEPSHQLRILEHFPKIQHEAWLARRKPREAYLTFAAACVLVFIDSKTDDAWPPHSGELSGHLLHDGDQFFGILTLSLIVDASDEVTRINRSRCGLVFLSHIKSLQAALEIPRSRSREGLRNRSEWHPPYTAP